MPHVALRIIPGVNTNETPAMNQAGVAQSNLIRYRYDPNGNHLVEKLGGWQRFVSTTQPAKVRALWAWEDTDSSAHLAVGTENLPASSQAQLSVITGASQSNITPRTATDNVTPAASSTSGSAIITITDATTTGITSYDSVYIPTQISIGGVVLFGLYACNPDGHINTTTYTVQAVDALGNALAATASSTSPALPQFATTSGSSTVTVTLANHGYAVGSDFPVLVATTVGGVTFYGRYPVQSVPSSSTFTITAPTQATATTTGYLNGGNAQFTYCFSIGSIPPGTGYGVGGYGRGAYGAGSAIVPSQGSPISASDWMLDNWGQILVACNTSTSAGAPLQPLWVWDPTSGSPYAQVIPQAPPYNAGFFVAMPERQIIAWGSTTDGIPDPLLVRWCDISNYASWIGTVQNQAGQYRLTRGSQIVGGMQGPQQGLLWTDVGLWSMQYVNQPYIWSFNEIGVGCGLIAKKAAGALNGVVYWMGPSQFYALSGEGVTPIPCPVWDVIFQDLDTTNLGKIRCAVNSLFGEVAWYYPTTASGGEVAAYVKFNVQLGVWDYGALGRSAWIDQSVLGPPIGADPPTRLIYQHETSPDADGQAMLPSFRTGYAAISEGDYKTFVDQIWPDAKFGYYGQTENTTFNVTIYAADFPGQTPRVYGPLPVTQATTAIFPRIRARLLAVEISSNDVGSFWRVGLVRYRAQPDGRY